MQNNYLIFTIINTVAIIFIPIFAVFIGQWLQKKQNQRDDKIKIFKILMRDRFLGWTNESVYALNILDIVFSKDKKVIDQWKIYKDRLTVENPTDTNMKKIDIEKYKLLEMMAKSLNYDISWETIQNPYFPQGMVNNFMQQQNYQNMQTEVMAKFKDLLNSGNAMKIENVKQ